MVIMIIIIINILIIIILTIIIDTSIIVIIQIVILYNFQARIRKMLIVLTISESGMSFPQVVWATFILLV